MRTDVSPIPQRPPLPIVEGAAAQLSNTVAVIGLGYVGLPLAKRLVDVGLDVSGVDINRDLVDALANGVSPLEKFGDDEIQVMIDAGFGPTSDFAAVREADTVVFCVPTPLDGDGNPDLRAVVGALTTALPHLRKGQLLSFESTTWPGTTREVIAPIIAELGFSVGKDIHVVFSPEREDPGNANFDIQNTPKLVGGLTPKCTELGIKFYKDFVDNVVPVSSSEVAEMAKVVENTFRYINISLVNELKISASRLGIDILEVLDACDTKPFGFMKFTPGPGIGGHCIPIDPHYLQWKSKEHGMDIQFISLARDINESMPNYVVETTQRSLKDFSKSLENSKLLVLGLAYKPDVADLRESPSLKIIDLLVESGAAVSLHDPFADQASGVDWDGVTYVDLTPAVLADHDAVLLLCDHSCFDYDMIGQNAELVVDTRGRFPASLPNIVRA